MKLVLTRILYTSLLYLFIPLELARLYWRGRFAPSYHHRWLERFAISLPVVNKGGIWIHTASVGESLAAMPVIRHLLKMHPNETIIVTTMTPTGSERIKAELGDAVYHVYAPYDLPDAVARFLNHLEPKKLLIMETELWPNIIAAAYSRGIKIVLMNARMSERSAKGYQLFRTLTQSLLNKFTVIAAQHQDDANRFIALGAEESHIEVTGNIKYDLTIKSGLVQQGSKLRKSFISELVWIAGSTHRGEDQQIFDAHKLVREQIPTAQLILVPRHPERFHEVGELCGKQIFTFTRRSLGEATDQPVYLGDTMGELLLLFAVADMAFVGGSLVEIGGHNLLEPAALAKPVMTGPYDHNFRDINRQMLASNAAVRIENFEQLAQQIIDWHRHPETMQAVGEQGFTVVKNNQGALKKLLTLIDSQ